MRSAFPSCHSPRSRTPITRSPVADACEAAKVADGEFGVVDHAAGQDGRVAAGALASVLGESPQASTRSNPPLAAGAEPPDHSLELLAQPLGVRTEPAD